MHFIVTFASGATEARTTAAAVFPYGERQIVLTEETPFHPCDYQWPDQPADKGAIEAGGAEFPLLDAVVVGISPDGQYYVGSDIPVKKSDPDWTFCVGHVIAGGVAPTQGEAVTLKVDEAYREAISRPHSATHVMSLALNHSFARRWRKEAPYLDALGNPNFDQIAMDTSQIGELKCLDQYRMGKSLRKKGFTSEGLREELKAHEEEINSLIAKWTEQDAPIVIQTDGDELMSRRYWTTVLDGKNVSVPCGGTHAKSLRAIGAIAISLEMPDDETLAIHTSVK
jgi:alanyl-tRNA synthetase